MFLDVIQKYTDFFVSWYSYSICTFCKQKKNSASNGIFVSSCERCIYSFLLCCLNGIFLCASMCTIRARKIAFLTKNGRYKRSTPN